MKREVNLGIYFIIYIAMPFLAFHFLQEKYPELGGSIFLYTMALLLILFISSALSLYMRYSSIPTAISVVATIIYMNFVFSNLHLHMMGADISISMGVTLLIIYALMALKIIVAVYEDMKQKHLSPSTHKGM